MHHTKKSLLSVCLEGVHFFALLLPSSIASYWIIRVHNTQHKLPWGKKLLVPTKPIWHKSSLTYSYFYQLKYNSSINVNHIGLPKISIIYAEFRIPEKFIYFMNLIYIVVCKSNMSALRLCPCLLNILRLQCNIAVRILTIGSVISII